MSDAAVADCRMEHFARSVHDRTRFESGAPLLDGWLKTQASQYEARDLARVYVLVRGSDPTVLGYYSLSSHTMVFDNWPEQAAKGLPRMDLPVVLLGRLAIDRSIQGQGWGEYLLIDALRRAEYLATKIGIRAVEVDAVDGTARRFYEKYGFQALNDDPRHLFLSPHVIRKLRLPPL